MPFAMMPRQCEKSGLVSNPMIEFATAPATLPPGQRVYAIGDVHGCLDRLTALHQAIGQDLAERPVADALLIHLGDYVDRGPDSAGVIALLSAGSPIPHMRTVNLMGNHEHMMLDALASGQAAAAELWLGNGGANTLFSWGVARQVKQTEWAGRMPPAQLIFLRDLALTHREGPYLFVHAGVRPGVPLDRQARQDLLWIRDPFLTAKGDLGVEPGGGVRLVVVHGHTPTREPVVRSNRIGIDTGAVMGGMLTCAVLEDDRLGFLTN
jgi:serine/threonine protein phosphatase 1